MRSAKVWIPLAILLAMTFALGAQAKDDGATKVNLYAGEYVPPSPYVQPIVSPETIRGFVIFNPTDSGKLEVTIHLQDGQPNTEFNAAVVPASRWSVEGKNPFTMTTNKAGKATAQVSLDIPDNATWVKVRLYDPATDTYLYATEQTFINFD